MNKAGKPKPQHSGLKVMSPLAAKQAAADKAAIEKLVKLGWSRDQAIDFIRTLTKKLMEK